VKLDSRFDIVETNVYIHSMTICGNCVMGWTWGFTNPSNCVVGRTCDFAYPCKSLAKLTMQDLVDFVIFCSVVVQSLMHKDWDYICGFDRDFVRGLWCNKMAT